MAKSDKNEWKQYYLDVIRALPNLVYVVDERCKLTACNEKMLHLLGIEDISDLQETLYSRLIRHTGYSESRIHTLKKDDIEALLSGKNQRDHDEPPVVDADGNIIYFQASRTPLYDQHNQVRGMLVVLTDVSERKKLESQFEKIREKLEEFNKRELKTTSLPPNVHRKQESPPNILVVEDNILAQKAAQSLLMQLDCLVDVADTIDKALALFKPGKYDLVFMDIGLQDSSGYLVSKKIRQLEDQTGYRVPIIALTGFEADVVKVDCNDYFMEGAITKPLSSDQARQIIEHYVHHIDIPVRGLKTSMDGEKRN